mmetsp:Transcript_34144/g.78835  ORF Transcript_34144/g.78835 Transcript_34144/m.78835 type:complete len:110 (-) Transcript_34144:107-436(-)
MDHELMAKARKIYGRGGRTSSGLRRGRSPYSPRIGNGSIRFFAVEGRGGSEEGRKVTADVKRGILAVEYCETGEGAHRELLLGRGKGHSPAKAARLYAIGVTFYILLKC